MPSFRNQDSRPTSRARNRSSRLHGRGTDSSAQPISARTASSRVVPSRARPQRGPSRATTLRAMPSCPEPSSPVFSNSAPPSPAPPSPAPASPVPAFPAFAIPAPSPPARPVPQAVRPEMGTSKSQPQPRSILNTNIPPQAFCFPSTRQECVVCRRPIERSYQEKDTWKSYHQPMALRAGSDQVVAAQQYLAGNALVHSCCWEVTWNALGCPSLNQGSFDNFVRHLVLLGPFASRTPFDCETQDVDHELWTDPPTRLRIEFEDEQEVRGILSSPSARETLRWLEQDPEVVLIEDLRKKDKFLAYCLRKAMPYSLVNETTVDVKSQLSKVIQNLKASDSSRLPKTYNLWTAWNNILSVLDAMKNSPPPLRVSSNPAFGGLLAVVKFRVPAEKCHRLTFSFTNLLPNPSVSMLGLSGIGWDGKIVGSGAYNFHVTVSSLKGIHLARAGGGQVTAIRVKDGEQWSSWYGTPRFGTDDMEHEWENPNKDLIFNFDINVKYLMGIGIKSRVSGSPA